RGRQQLVVCGPVIKLAAHPDVRRLLMRGDVHRHPVLAGEASGELGGGRLIQPHRQRDETHRGRELVRNRDVRAQRRRDDRGTLGRQRVLVTAYVVPTQTVPEPQRGGYRQQRHRVERAGPVEGGLEAVRVVV